MQKTELRLKPTETVPEFSKTSRRFRGGRALGLLIGTLVLFGAIALASDTFLKPYTMFIIARQIAFSILIALSQAVCLVVGGMNLSVGAIGSMATVILGLCFQELKLNAWLAVPITIIFGVVSGAINGLIITRLKINSFIVTLSLMFVYMGLRSGISGGSPYIIPQDFGFIGQNAIFGVSWVFVFVCLILLATGYMFSYTKCSCFSCPTTINTSSSASSSFCLSFAMAYMQPFHLAHFCSLPEVMRMLPDCAVSQPTRLSSGRTLSRACSLLWLQFSGPR
jgi:predicted ABC-type sugar transport system permease subunit